MKRFILVISALILFSLTISRQYEENPEDIAERLRYLNSHSQEITSGKIIYRYSNQTGIYCEATTNIDKKEYVYTIKKDYVISFCNE